MRIRDIGKVLLAAGMGLTLAGCATMRAPDERDPWEPVNRATFEVNETLDRALLKPVAEGYRFVLPSEVRTGVRNFFANLNDPWIAVNQLLQGKVEEALSDVWRFIVNSTFGIGGIFDIASDMQMPKHNEDFGQTMAVWGLPFGPYLVLPVLGPSSGRDGIGAFVGAYAYVPWFGPEWFDFNHRVTWRTSLTSLDFIQVRASLLDATTALDQAALDRYAFVRNAYFQRRRNLIYDGNPPAEKRPAEPAEEAPARSGAVEPKMPAN
jgi:phospholipid-binding lipoprotein MlaA